MSSEDYQEAWESSDLTVRLRRLSSGTTIVDVVGAVRGQGATALRQRLNEEVIGSAQRIIVELSEVTLIDGQGIDALRSGAEIAGETDVGFCLVAPAHGPVTQAFAAARVSELFETFASIGAALQNCG